MNAVILALSFGFFSVSLASAEESVTNWRDDRELLESYHSDLAGGRISQAVLRIINWCTAKYEDGVVAGSLSETDGKRLIADIQEAARALEFVLNHEAAIRKLDDGTLTFGVFLGCFETLFEMDVTRDGSGVRYEQFVKAYYESREATRSMLSKHSKKSE